MNAQASKDTAATTTIVKPPYMQNRELSWLDFNKRVLDQGADPTVPLLERLNFISIFWSNLQEFFMVRVGSLVDQENLSPSMRENKTHMTPREQIDAVIARVHELNKRRDAVYADLMERLEEQGVRLVDFRKIGRQESEARTLFRFGNRAADFAFHRRAQAAVSIPAE